MRSDCGTENCYVAAIQRFFRDGHEDQFGGDNSFMSGRSVSNQRIEAWWSMLRKIDTDFWISYFKDLRETGLYNDGNIIHVNCLKFCFMPLLQEEVSRCAELWNLHRIRPQSLNYDSPSGRPDILYFLPELKGRVNYVHEVTLDDIEVAEEVISERQRRMGTGANSFQIFEELAKMIMEDDGLSSPNNPDEALQLYTDLLEHIETLI